MPRFSGLLCPNAIASTSCGDAAWNEESAIVDSSALRTGEEERMVGGWDELPALLPGMLRWAGLATVGTAVTVAARK